LFIWDRRSIFGGGSRFAAGAVADTELRITWKKPSDFAPSVVNGEEAYWVRCVVTAFNSPSITTSPLGDQAWLFLEKEVRATYEHVID
jgi:hypothetical protein